MAKLTALPKLTPRWEQSVDDHVIALAWSPNGYHLAAAAVSGPVVIFDESGQTLHTIDAHGFGTASLCWSPDSKTLATAGQDGHAKHWDPKTGTLKEKLAAGAAWVEHVAYSPKGDLLLTAAGKKLKLWNADGTPNRTFPDYRSTIAGLAWMPKGKEFVVAGYGGVSTYKVDAPDSEGASKFFEWQGSVIAIAASPDSSMLAGGAQDSSVHFWYTKTGDDLAMTGYPAKVNILSWDATSRYLATGGGEHAVIWDCSGKGPEGSTPIMCEFHEQTLSAITFQTRGGLLATGCPEGHIALWWPGNANKNLTKAKLDQGITRFAWHPTDNRLAVGGEAGKVALYAV
jgi:WD40 repeat protein